MNIHSHKKNIFVMLESGTMCSLQNLSVHQNMIEGVAQGGPIDEKSFFYATQLLHGHVTNTVIEIFYGGVKLNCLNSAIMTLTGAHQKFYINQSEVKAWETHKVREGDEIFIPYQKDYLVSYLAVNGDMSLNSKEESLQTVRIEKGDVVSVNNQKESVFIGPRSIQRQWKSSKNQEEVLTVRFISTPFLTLKDEQEKERLCQTIFTIAKDISRIGYRLEGPSFEFKNLKESMPLLEGSIQIPQGGKPIILLKDRQTVGGYPFIGAVIASDLNQFVQLCPGSKIKLQEISIEQAEKIESQNKVNYLIQAQLKNKPSSSNNKV